MIQHDQAWLCIIYTENCCLVRHVFRVTFLRSSTSTKCERSRFGDPVCREMFRSNMCLGKLSRPHYNLTGNHWLDIGKSFPYIGLV